MRWDVADQAQRIDVFLEPFEPLYLGPSGMRHLPRWLRWRLLFCKAFAHLFGFGDLVHRRVLGVSLNSTLWGLPAASSHLSFAENTPDLAIHVAMPHRRPTYIALKNILFWGGNIATRTFIETSLFQTKEVLAFLGTGIVAIALPTQAEFRTLASPAFVHLSRLIYCDGTLTQILPSPERPRDPLVKFSPPGELVVLKL